MKNILLIILVPVMAFMVTTAGSSQGKWKIHDKNRPLPPVIEPGTVSGPALPPADAIVLFKGKDLSQWEDSNGKPAHWKVKNDYMEVVKMAGAIRTVRKFGDCQLHIEWSTPLPALGKGQGRGNSGVFLMDLYEVQVLDCYNNQTYADGMAGAIYGQHPPLVNACRPPGKWQSFDIIFHRPLFADNGSLTQPARMTVLHNGVLIQDNAELTGPTAWKKRPPYKPHASELPISLQDHGNPVRYRNIWVRKL